jgi:hypothetical protein
MATSGDIRWPPAGRNDGHQWGISWPPVGRNRWPLTSPEDLVELMRLQRAFADGSRRLHAGTAAVLEKAAATGEIASVPPRALCTSIEDSLKQMVLAQPPRFKSIEATPSGDAD